MIDLVKTMRNDASLLMYRRRLRASGEPSPRIVAAMASPAETSAAGALAFTLSVTNSPEGVSWTFALGEGAPAQFELDEGDTSQGLVAGLLAYASAPYAVPIVATSDEETPTILNRTFNVPITPLVQAGVTRSVSSMRAQAIEAIWLGAGLPTGGIDSVDDDVESPLVDIPAPSNLASVDELFLDVGLSQGLRSHFVFHPVVSNGEAAIYHAGHGDTIGGENRQEWIAALIQAGYTTVVMRMPLDGYVDAHNLLPEPDAELNPGKYFWEPPIRVFNWLLTQGFSADQICFSGHSGGGHTVAVVAALDPRIRASAQSAGSLPLYIADSSRDYEQFLPGLSEFLDYTDLYVMACDGGREQISILSENDPICFPGTAVEGASHAFVERVEAAAAAVGGTWSLQVEDSSIHQMTPNARATMLNLFARHSTVAPVVSSPVDTGVSNTTANVGATTNKANGTLYAVATSSATPPSAAQIKAGLDHTGAPAAGSGSTALTAIGAKTALVTGLTVDTAYFGHVMHEDAAGNQSNVVTGDGFTTVSNTVPSAFVAGDWELDAGDEFAVVTINSRPADGGSTITDIEYRLDTGSWVSSGGIVSFVIDGLTNDQEYDVELRAVNSVGGGSASDVKAVTPSTSAFDTDAPAIFAAFATPPHGLRQLLINDLVLQLKNDGVWSKLSGLWVMAAADRQAAKINWVDPGTYDFTEVGSPSFTENVGFNSGGNGANYLTPGVTYETLMAQNDAHLGHWLSKTGNTDNANTWGRADGDGNTRVSLNAENGHSVGIFTTSSQILTRAWTEDSHFVAVRRGASETEAYMDGVSRGTSAATSESPAGGNARLMNSSNSPSPVTLWFEIAHTGDALSDTEVADLYAAFAAYREGLVDPVAPSAFGSDDWSIASGDERAFVTINSLPNDGGAAITDVEYRLDGGSWVSSSGTGNFTITDLTNDTEYDVELRAVNSAGEGPASDTKPVTPEESDFDAASEAIFAAFTTPPDDTRKELINDLVVQLKSDGLWSKINGLWVCAAADAQAAKINWKSPGTNDLTEVNSPAFVTDVGFNSGSGGYLTVGAGYEAFMTQNDGHLGLFASKTGDVSGGNAWGRADGAGNTRFALVSTAASDGAIFANLQQFSGSNVWSGDTIHLTYVRRGASEQEAYRDGTSIHTNTNASQTPAGGHARLLNSNGAAASNTLHVEIAHLGTALSDAEAALLYAAFAAYRSGL